jgi:transposase
MSQQEMLVLGTRDRDRLKVLHEVREGHLTQRQAGERLGISDRWVRTLLRRVKKEGDRGVIHRLRGRVSNRRLSEKVRRKVRKLVEAHYRDFGPTLACEYLAKDHAVVVSKESLRQLLIAAGLWRARRRKVEAVHLWRPRRSSCGELVQWDTSQHDWLEGRGPRLYLVALIDDATSRAYARFVTEDSTEENLRVLGGYLKRWGRPLEFYTDQHSLFSVNRPRREAADEAVEEERTQIGRALQELGVGWIPAHSPQAKGRIERFFGTAQDRLVKGLRLAAACTREAANTYLEEEYLPLWNKRFTVEAVNRQDAHRPLGAEHDLAAMLSQVEERVVANDYTLRYAGQLYQIARADIGPGLRGGVVRVERRLDQSVWVRFRDRYLNVAPCVAKPQPLPAQPLPTAAPTAKKSKTPSRWMDGFRLKESPPLWKILREEGAGAPRAPGDFGR